MGKDKEIVVTGPKDEFFEPTHPGKARKLIRNGKADLVSKDPPAIRLKTIPGGSNQMKKRPVERRTVELTKFFEKERSIYVQNISGSPRQILLEFKDNNNESLHMVIPEGRDPICLTDHIPFEYIKKSFDFRKMLQRRPSILRLMDADDYDKHFHQKQETQRLAGDTRTVDEFIDDAERRAVEVTEHRRMPQQQMDSPPQTLEEMSEEMQMEDEVLSPRVLHIVRQCDKDMKEQRMKAEDALEFLANMELSDDDLNYVMANIGYPQLVKWAKMMETQKGSLKDIADTGTTLIDTPHKTVVATSGDPGKAEKSATKPTPVE